MLEIAPIRVGRQRNMNTHHFFYSHEKISVCRSAYRTAGSLAQRGFPFTGFKPFLGPIFAISGVFPHADRRRAVSFNTKPFKHRALVWIGFKKVLLFPLCWDWWLARVSACVHSVTCGGVLPRVLVEL